MLVFGLILGGFLLGVDAGFGGGGGYQQQSVPEINQHDGVARWSAQSAVASAVGRDYANQLSTTAQYANQFTAPVTKEQAQQAFNAVRYQQQGSLVSAALANAAPAINQASRDASTANFQQAYAAAEGSRLSGAAHDAASQQMVYLAGSALASQQLQSSQAAHYADQAKTQQTQTNANALQAINGINSVDRAASYGK